MAYEIFNLMFTLPASADLSAAQFRAVVCNSSAQAATSGAAAPIIGVLQNKPSAVGQAATIMAEGVTNAVAGAAVTAGASLETDSTGRFVTLAAGIRVGIALQSATAANQVISVLLTR